TLSKTHDVSSSYCLSSCFCASYILISFVSPSLSPASSTSDFNTDEDVEINTTLARQRLSFIHCDYNYIELQKQQSTPSPPGFQGICRISFLNWRIAESQNRQITHHRAELNSKYLCPQIVDRLCYNYAIN